MGSLVLNQVNGVEGALVNHHQVNAVTLATLCCYVCDHSGDITLTYIYVKIIAIYKRLWPSRMQFTRQYESLIEQNPVRTKSHQNEVQRNEI